MPDRQTLKLEVTVELDPVPGAFHEPESAASYVQIALWNVIPHYNPQVTIVK